MHQSSSTRRPHWLIGVLLSGLISCTALPEPVLPPVSMPSDVRNSELDAPTAYRVLAGEIALQSGANDVAFGMLLKAAEESPDPALFQRATEIALQARAGGSALKAVSSWIDAYPASVSAWQQKFVLELTLQKAQEATRTLRSLIALLSADELTDLGIRLPRLLERLPEPELRTQLISDAFTPIKDDPTHGPTARAILGTALMQSGDAAGAFEHAREALSQAPSNLLALSLAVASLEGPDWSLQPKIDDYLATPDANSRLRYFYAKTLSQNSHTRAALKTLQVAGPDSQLDAQARLLKAQLLLDHGQWNSAKQIAAELFDELELAESEAGASVRQDALLLLIDHAKHQQDWQEASRWLDQLEGGMDPTAIAFQRAKLLTAQGELDEAQALIAALNPSPASPPSALELRLSWMQIQLLQQAEQWQQAYLRARAVHESRPDDPDWTYTLGMLAERVKKFDEMERLMRRHMELAPDDHQAHNALGYSLADRGLRLSEAKTLIQHALTIVPNDPFVIDSWGWVLFRLGDTAQAAQALTRAWSMRADPEIAAHLGEVLWRSGDTDRARTTWQEGLTIEPDNQVLLETIQRLTSKP